MANIGVSSYHQALQGDRSALESLIRTYSDPLVRFAYSYLRDASAAEEVVEESIATLFVKPRDIWDEAHLRSYLYKIVRSRCADQLRHHRRNLPLSEVEQVLSCCDLEKDVLRRERDRIIFTAMQILPHAYREVLMLIYFEGLTNAQICQVMKKKPKQVYNLHARAKTALKTLLEKEGISDEDL